MDLSYEKDGTPILHIFKDSGETMVYRGSQIKEIPLEKLIDEIDSCVYESVESIVHELKSEQ